MLPEPPESSPWSRDARENRSPRPLLNAASHKRSRWPSHALVSCELEGCALSDHSNSACSTQQHTSLLVHLLISQVPTTKWVLWLFIKCRHSRVNRVQRTHLSLGVLIFFCFILVLFFRCTMSHDIRHKPLDTSANMAEVDVLLYYDGMGIKQGLGAITLFSAITEAHTWPLPMWRTKTLCHEETKSVSRAGDPGGGVCGSSSRRAMPELWGQLWRRRRRQPHGDRHRVLWRLLLQLLLQTQLLLARYPSFMSIAL